MSWAPVTICGGLIAATYGLVEFGGWDARLAGFVIAVGAFALVTLVGAVCLLFLAPASRQAFREAVFETAKKDLADISSRLTFRR